MMRKRRSRKRSPRSLLHKWYRRQRSAVHFALLVLFCLVAWAGLSLIQSASPAFEAFSSSPPDTEIPSRGVLPGTQTPTQAVLRTPSVTQVAANRTSPSPLGATPQSSSPLLPSPTRRDLVAASSATPSPPVVLAGSDCGQTGAGGDWPLYSNSQFQYSVRYPIGFTITEQPKQVLDILHSTRFLLPKDVTTPQPNEIDITIFDNPLSQSTSSWFETHRKPVDGSAAIFENITTLRHCTVANLDALMFQETAQGSVHRILVSRANRVFSILVVDYNNSDWTRYFLAMAATIRWIASSR